MITGNDIHSLVSLLENRQVSLYHACQLLDFQSYVDLGGVPSRALLETEQARFTPFQTDANDRENDVWDKVFVNLIDFGGGFARGANNVPNPYGPILLQMLPSALLEASDVAVCLWSAGAKGFNREREALTTVEDIDRLFLYSANAPFPESTYVKYRHQLAKEFGKQKAQDPEISCTIPSGLLPLKYVTVVWTDPYVVKDKLLHDWVCEIKREYGARFRVIERHCQDDSRINLYSEIAERITVGIPPLDSLAQSETCSQLLRNWANQLRSTNLEWQFRRYAEYLREGTLKVMSKPDTLTVTDEE